jgi:peptide/nickel transport system substrate-binding protein
VPTASEGPMHPIRLLLLRPSRWLQRLTLCLAFALPGAQAQAPMPALRIASAFDPQTMDPQALALLYHSRVVFQIYESLVTRDQAFRIEPGLALKWEMTGPTTWRFDLRPGVVFDDGTPFSADDAVFSIERALAAPSQRAFQLEGVTAVKALGPLAIEIDLAHPDAVLPSKLQFIAMMSRA